MRPVTDYIASRTRQIDASGIRRVFDLGAQLADPLNLSIGQPDFDVPEPVREAAIEAIRGGANAYTPTQGLAVLRAKLASRLAAEFPHTLASPAGDALRDDLGLLVTSGVSGGLLLALWSCVEPGDEVLIPDPYFVMYKQLVLLMGATPVYVDTYPDFQMTAQRNEAAITPRTKLVIFNTPSNPTGVVAPADACRAVAELCDRRGVLLVSDEIYDAFCYEPFHSPIAHTANALLLRGFSKTYATTGWRLGYAVGPKAIVEEMTKLQQYSFVCAPHPLQVAAATALDVDMSALIADYAAKRDRVVQRLDGHYPLTAPGGAFYAFPQVPAALGLSGTAFVERAIQHNLLIIPGNVFSQRDTHFRISYATRDDKLEAALDVLVGMAGG